MLSIQLKVLYCCCVFFVWAHYACLTFFSMSSCISFQGGSDSLIIMMIIIKTLFMHFRVQADLHSFCLSNTFMCKLFNCSLQNNFTAFRRTLIVTCSTCCWSEEVTSWGKTERSRWESLFIKSTDFKDFNVTKLVSLPLCNWCTWLTFKHCRIRFPF